MDQTNLQPYPQPYEQPCQPPPAFQPPQVPLPNDRSLLVVVLLTIVTFGIYGIVLYCRLGNEINEVAAQADGKHTTHYIVCLLLGLVTFGIYPLVWMHKYCERVGGEAVRRNTGLSFGALDYWLLSFLLSFTLVCPLIFQYKLLEATNAINTSYNMYG